MVVTIIDSLTTISEVCLLQSHEMNTRTKADQTTRVFSDDMIATNINNVIRFVLGNSRSDLDAYIKIFAINTLSVICLNNIMKEAGYLAEWEYQDAFDKERLLLMITNMKEDQTVGVDSIRMYTNAQDPYNNVY